MSFVAICLFAFGIQVSPNSKNSKSQPKEEMVMIRAPAGFATNVRKVDNDLVMAVIDNNLDEARLLISKGANPNFGMYPPLLSVHGTHQQIMSMADMLIENGAKVNVETGLFGSNVITQLLEHPDEKKPDVDPSDLVHYFIGKGVHVSYGTSSGETALHFAVRNGWLKCVKELLANKADVNARTKVISFDPKDIFRDAYSANDKFYDDWNEPGYRPTGMTPLHFAFDTKWNPEVVNALLDAGADIRAVTTNGWFVLHYAAHNHSKEAVNFCLSKGFQINQRTTLGNTALHLAMFPQPLWPSKEFAAFLFSLGVDKSLKNKQGETALAMIDRRAKLELNGISKDPDSNPYQNGESVTKYLNETRQFFDPKAKSLEIPEPPTFRNGIHYDPYEMGFLHVVRVVKPLPKSTLVTLTFTRNKQSEANRVQVKLQRPSMAGELATSPNDVHFELKKGESKRIRIVFPQSAGTKLKVRFKYEMTGDDGSGTQGG